MTDEHSRINERQFVVMVLSDEEYGIPIIQVQEIVCVPDITRVPGMPDFVEGIINLRGKIVPVIDLRKRFSLAEKAYDDKSRIIVADVDKQSIGLVVDNVSEVLRLSDDQIDALPPAISQISTEYLSGIGKLEKRLIILLDLQKVLTDLEKVTLAKLSKKQELTEA